jgi:DNA gyrase/topoisomerase IV subunit A
MESGEKLRAMLRVQEFDDQRFVVMGTRKGTIKKTELSAFSNPRAGGIIADGHRGRRRGHRRAAVRRPERDLHRHEGRQGDPLRGR